MAQLLDVRVQAVLEVDEGILRPKMPAEFFAGNQLAGAVEQKREDSNGLALEFEFHAALPQLGCLPIEFEGCKTELLYALDWQMYPTLQMPPTRPEYEEKSPYELDVWEGRAVRSSR